MPQVTIGGERLGSGNRMKAYMHNYERSTHDLSFVWRSTMAAGTLVPFMTEVALPGDTFDINLDCDVLTHPTIGPLFGTYKIQCDVFQIPVRLYQGALHMNMLNIGRDMSKIPLPQIFMSTGPLDPTMDMDNQQINPSCIFSYLGIRGIGANVTGPDAPARRKFNAIPYLGFWEIYKNYYANKQEEIGVVIHKNLEPNTPVIIEQELRNDGNTYGPLIGPTPDPPTNWTPPILLADDAKFIITATGVTKNTNVEQFQMFYREAGIDALATLNYFFHTFEIIPDMNLVICTNPVTWAKNTNIEYAGVRWIGQVSLDTLMNTEPELISFPLSNIDDMREAILQWPNTGAEFIIDSSSPAPYGLPLFSTQGTPQLFNKTCNQEGLPVKTYQSDLFNNWISTEWIDGADGISAITAVDTSAGSFTIDELNLSKKIYDMLNRIALSGGTYDDWLDAVYTHDRQRSAESPMYIGGLIKNLIFQEVVSNAETDSKPLGTLAGRGKPGNKHKGGNIIAKIDEPSYIMGIVSITPNVDYSQGNKWDVNLKTMNDFHKPALDEIGFQDLITDQMTWWETRINDADPQNPVLTYTSAGKQPAWINYMTNVNVCRGNFAIQNQQMFMTLNRRYSPNFNASTGPSITDLTTYIDPSKFNFIFADTRRDAQNFWTQIAVNIEARRKMSAKVIPNL